LGTKQINVYVSLFFVKKRNLLSSHRKTSIGNKYSSGGGGTARFRLEAAAEFGG